MPTVELTDRFCASAKPIDGKQADYFDTVVRGLHLRVSPAGTRTWSIMYTKPGETMRARLKLGRFPEMKLGKARERARATRGEIGEGGDPIAQKKALAASQTVADLVDNYIERHASSKRSGDEIARRLRKNVTGEIGAIRLADLHRRDLTRCIDAVKDRGAHIEANRIFEDLRAMVRWARGRGDLDHNLVEGMRKPSETSERDRVLSAREIEAFWKALPAADMRDSSKRILRLCLVTGQRVGEIAGMTRDELDRKTAVWTIPGARAKNKREHVVPLSKLALEIIAEQLEASDALAVRKVRDASPFVFPGPGSVAATTAASLPKALKRLETNTKESAKVFGIAPFTPHDLRRTAATLMAESGVSPFIIGHVLNHASITRASVTSRVYVAYDYSREKREALDTLAGMVAGIITGGATVTPMRNRRHG